MGAAVLVCVQPCVFQSCVLCPGTSPSSVAPGRKPREVEWRYAPASMEAARLQPAARSPNTNPCRLRYARASRARPEIPPHLPDQQKTNISTTPIVHRPHPPPTTVVTYTSHAAFTASSRTTTAAAAHFSFQTFYISLGKKSHFSSMEINLFDLAFPQLVLTVHID